MIIHQSLNAFYDKMAQFTLIPLAAVIAFSGTDPLAAGVNMEVLSTAGLMMALPVIVLAPLTGWVSDRFSKRDVILAASAMQAVMLALIYWAVWIQNMPLAMGGLIALAVQGAFLNPAKIGINKELVGSNHLGFAVGIQQMTAMLAILSAQIFAGWQLGRRFAGHGSGAEFAWQTALAPLAILAVISVLGLVIAWAIPRMPVQGRPEFTAKLAVSHFSNLGDLWRDLPMRRASFGIAFFWGFVALINLWSLKVANSLSEGGEQFGTMSAKSMVAVALGMAVGFGIASFLLRRRIELGWVPAAGIAMTLAAAALAFIPPGGWTFLIILGLLGLSGAVFLTPLSAWMQDRYPPAERGKFQSAVNLQDGIAAVIAVLVSGIFEYGTTLFGISPALGVRLEIGFMAIVCGLMSLSILRLLPGDFIRLVGGAIIRAIYRIQVVNPERIPTKGGALLLPNHVTFADALFISAACPRPVRFVMDEAFMAQRSIRLFVSLFDTVTIRRDQPREAIRITIEALKKGDLVCLFPEGQLSRSGTLNELRRGFELIAKKAGHPLIPMWCDGSWGSIFSFERGRFFRKRPYRMTYGLRVAFDGEINPENADLETVRQGMLVASAAALASRFEAPGWGGRIPKGKGEQIRSFRAGSEASRRQLWANGYQIGQINALQWRQPFHGLSGDPVLLGLPGVVLAFPELFGAECVMLDYVDGDVTAAWVGGDMLRSEIGQTQLTGELVFYDFGKHALEPIHRAGLLHCPCLAVDGIVLAMSMPHPLKPTADSGDQTGHKLGTWGKLLPGWFLLPAASGGLRAHGPAAPKEGLPLPAKCFLDAEGYLARGK